MMALLVVMALQELVTNAGKTGALSSETGQILVHRARDGTEVPQRLYLLWEEMG
jgi:two-component sensor histidine kinase